MIKRIVAPTDGSPDSSRALPAIKALAAAQDAEVLLVQVVEFPTLLDSYNLVPAEAYQELEDATAQAARDNLARLAADLDETGIRASATLLWGSPSIGLVDFEKEHEADLTVLASHGLTGIKRFTLGSVADRLVREGSAPVLVVRGDGVSTDLKRALLMLDGSGVAEAALPIVKDLAGRPVEHVTLFRAVADPADRNAAAHYLEAIQADLAREGLRTEIAVEVGDPALLVERAANDADFIVLSTHGRGGFDRIRHGSVAEQVVRKAERPVLLVRAGAVGSEKRETGMVATTA
jgi:nucleotide-binding universal stress UspA family protein